MAATDEQTEKRLRLKRDFSDLLERDHGSGQYVDDIRELMGDGTKLASNRLRLEIDVHDLRSFKKDLHRELFDDPSDCIPAFEDALDEFVRTLFPKRLQDKQQVSFVVASRI